MPIANDSLQVGRVYLFGSAKSGYIYRRVDRLTEMIVFFTELVDGKEHMQSQMVRSHFCQLGQREFTQVQVLDQNEGI